MSDNQEQPGATHLTNEERTFLQLSSTFRDIQTAVQQTSDSLRTAQTAIAQHFQTATMKELHLFRTLEKRIRSNDVTAENMQETLTSLNILRVDSMAEISVIMADALMKLREEAGNKE